jgi:hypothetical protein
MSKRWIEELSIADPCLFYRKQEDRFLYIAIYVEDGFVVVNETEVFLGLCQEKFKITFGGDEQTQDGSLENLLGMQIKC